MVESAHAAKTGWERSFERLGLAVSAAYVLAIVAFAFAAGDDAGHTMPSNGLAAPRGGHGMAGSGSSANPGHGVPSFLQSFGAVSLLSMGAYVGGMAVWGWWRRGWPTFARHAATAAALLVLVALYLAARGGLAYDGHNWNRSFADASVVLYAATLGIGPLAKVWRAAAPALAWRRETGIWATIAAVVHVGIFWEWSLGWEWRPFFYAGGSNSLLGDRAAGIRPDVFHLANAVGLVAWVYALVLTFTSNDVAQRLLRGGWSWLMKRSNTMWLLVLLHTWAFAYYVTREQTLPIGALWASFWAVLLLQTLGFTKTLWARRLGRTATVQA